MLILSGEVDELDAEDVLELMTEMDGTEEVFQLG